MYRRSGWGACVACSIGLSETVGTYDEQLGKKLVVIYTFDESTSAFKVTFGEGARTFTLDDADVGNPLGKLARGKSTEAGVQGITFATKSSPGCITGCVGKYCGTVC